MRLIDRCSTRWATQPIAVWMRWLVDRPFADLAAWCRVTVGHCLARPAPVAGAFDYLFVFVERPAATAFRVLWNFSTNTWFNWCSIR